MRIPGGRGLAKAATITAELIMRTMRFNNGGGESNMAPAKRLSLWLTFIIMTAYVSNVKRFLEGRVVIKVISQLDHHCLAVSATLWTTV